MQSKSLFINTIFARSLLLAFLLSSMPAVADEEDAPEDANREPAIVHQSQQQEAEDKLRVLERKLKQKHNFLVFLVDDMGWGDPGVYGGGEAIGAATPNIEPPLLGANNEDILCSIGGVRPEELARMKSDGVV